MVENEIMNYKVLVDLAKDSVSSHFSGNECIYRPTVKNCFTAITV